MTVWVKSRRGGFQTHPYPVHLGEGLLPKTGSLLKKAGLSGKVLVVTQRPVAKFYLGALLKSLRGVGFRSEPHFILDGEEAKSQKQLFKLFQALVEKDFERRDVILALGGGVVGDVAGFAAATYLRGVPFVNIATTLLAQVDSSIGGKTGINLGAGKNLVGAFYPPRVVISDIRCLETLPSREYRASLAEVVKYGIIRDPALFRLFELRGEKILARDLKTLTVMIHASAQIKAKVVGSDEFETKGERMILNYGHTFGHGFEQALEYRKLMHGEAVAIGMRAAGRLAVRLGIFSERNEERQLEVLRRLHLPVSLSGLSLDAEDILSAMQRDKKKKEGRLRFILPTQIGKVIVKKGIPLRLIRTVIQECM